uniref:Uncharacterized protein n=1 Tax=Anguilla anguilla TaxID=7936 RepID=A0A0E9UZ08_ANGAN
MCLQDFETFTCQTFGQQECAFVLLKSLSLKSGSLKSGGLKSFSVDGLKFHASPWHIKSKQQPFS